MKGKGSEKKKVKGQRKRGKSRTGSGRGGRPWKEKLREPTGSSKSTS